MTAKPVFVVIGLLIVGLVPETRLPELLSKASPSGASTGPDKKLQQIVREGQSPAARECVELLMAMSFAHAIQQGSLFEDHRVDAALVEVREPVKWVLSPDDWAIVLELRSGDELLVRWRAWKWADGHSRSADERDRPFLNVPRKDIKDGATIYAFRVDRQDWRRIVRKEAEWKSIPKAMVFALPVPRVQGVTK